MSAPIELDYTWLLDATCEVDCGATSVVVVETRDPFREDQCTAYVLAQAYTEVYAFEPWNGLGQWDPRHGRFEQVRAAAAQAYDAGLQNDLRDLEGALRHLDARLKRVQAALIVRGVDRPDGQLDRNAPLSNAIRHWAHHHEILCRRSLVFLITPAAGRTIDEATLSLAALARPPLATDDERAALADSVASQVGPAPSANARRALTVATAGLTLKQTQSALHKSWHLNRSFDAGTVKRFKSDYIRRTDMLEIEEPAHGFDDVGGYARVKAMVRENFTEVLNDAARAAADAVDLPRGIILFGPPGTGKTLFAKAMARETNLPFINLKTENIFSKWLGESGQRLRDAKTLAEQASPAIVFIDEIDRLGRRGGGGGDGASQETGRVYSQMLEWLGDPERKAIILGTTNMPEHLDEAFIRAKRVDFLVPFLYPDAEARDHILRLHLGLVGTRPGPRIDPGGVEDALSEVVRQTEHYAGADLEEIVMRAKRLKFLERAGHLTGGHLLRAHRDYRVPIDDRIGLVQRYRALDARFANSLDAVG